MNLARISDLDLHIVHATPLLLSHATDLLSDPLRTDQWDRRVRCQLFLDEPLHAQPFIQLAKQNQATVENPSRSLEIDLQAGIEGELKGPILCLTHWGAPSGRPDALRPV